MWHFSRGGYVDIKRILPFVLASIPMAYVGGNVLVEKRFFMIVLGASLLAAGAHMFFTKPAVRDLRLLPVVKTWLIGLPAGALLGYVSGMVGIGGGIFLAPVMLMSGWADEKQTAAAASLFIFVNSVAGLFGQFTKGVFIGTWIIPLVIAVLIGGQLGSRAGSYHLPLKAVRQLLASLIIIVSIRLMWKAI